MIALRTESLTYWAGGSPVIRNVGIEVDDGAFVALVGPNGAGKTTLLRCIIGVLRCLGRVEVYGVELARRPAEVRRLLGYLPQMVRFPPGLTAEDAVKLHVKLYGVTGQALDILAEYGLSHLARRPVDSMSGGERQRLALALALAHGPRLLLLDEPFNNLDSEARAEAIKRLLDLRGKTTIMAALHGLGELASHIDAVVEMQRGEVVYAGPPRHVWNP